MPLKHERHLLMKKFQHSFIVFIGLLLLVWVSSSSQEGLDLELDLSDLLKDPQFLKESGRKSKKGTDEEGQEDLGDELGLVLGKKGTKCPKQSKTADRRQSIFNSLIRRWRKELTRNQPWKRWARKVVRCSLTPELFDDLDSFEKVRVIANAREILQNELDIRQEEAEEEARKIDPCHPFAIQRARLIALVLFRKSLEKPGCNGITTSQLQKKGLLSASKR
eukprot:TRINITY_DN1851_c0_g1_i2.p1 TRINITY_DN1851_c0_g1~~TRINITY_DN1851_c0_g1_i2.p1  ORF type:complete len:221 (-),score=49.31 TRINITY_DN1851_c0_g1_i2:95-757(-)